MMSVSAAAGNGPAHGARRAHFDKEEWAVLGNEDVPVDTGTMVRRIVAVSALLLASTSCATYHDQLARSQQAFEVRDNNRALALLRDLEPDLPHLALPEQAQYAYLRGMIDYRVGYKPDARHWLSLAKAYEDHSPGVLPADWKARVAEALDDLNGVIYAGGTTALVTSRTEDTGVDGPGAGDAKDTKSAKEPRGSRRDSRTHKGGGPRNATTDGRPRARPRQARGLQSGSPTPRPP